MFSRIAIIAAASLTASLCLNAPPTEAHIVLDRKEAAAGSAYKAVFRVPHGCEGSPTTAIRVTLPEGILSAKPQPKPGWTLTTEKAALPEPVPGPRGKPITEVVKTISWSGGSLDDAHFDEFAIQLRLPDAQAGTMLYFPVLQTCEKGERDWKDAPEQGRGHEQGEGQGQGHEHGHSHGHGHGGAHDHHMDDPAPALRLVPKG